MGADQTSAWHETIASALAWWREAGVDVEVQDAPRNWLNAVPTTRATAIAAAEPSPLPATTEAFATWRLGPDVPEHQWGGRMFAADGPASADLMVMIEMPERDDAAEGRLLGGASGRLFDRMLAAIGLNRDTIHLTSVAAVRPVAGRIPRDAVEPLSTIARHYVTLVRPRVLLLLGNGPCQVMLGDLCTSARGSLRPLNHDGPSKALASFHPQQLIERPQLKAESWKDLQMLTSELRG